MPYTVNKKLSVQAAASNSGVWGAGGTTGDDLNTGVMGTLDTILAGVSSFSVSASNVTLSFVAGGGGDVSNAMWRFTGTLLANITVSPAAGDATTYFKGFYFFENSTSGNFTITVQNATGSCVLPIARFGCIFVDNIVGPRVMSSVGSTNPEAIPFGTQMLFVQASVPAGWVVNAGLNDIGLRVVSSSGGGTGGTIGFSGVFGAGLTTSSYALQVADLPPHSHTFTYGTTVTQFTSNSTVVNSIQTSGGANSVTTQNTGSGGGHVHGLNLNLAYVNVLSGTRQS